MDKIRGCLFGMAYGDALGALTEFLDMHGIRQRFPPSGPRDLIGDPAKVTDDTQMALAVGEALVNAPHPYAPESLAKAFEQAFIDWYNDPQNNRAPGNTCLNSCENLIDGQDWRDATDISSKGCGSNMRVQPVGCLDVDATTRAGIAQLQAAITHAHPTGLAAADLTAFVIADLRDGLPVATLTRRVREYARSQRTVYHADWLGDLWKRAYMMRTPEEYIAHGWDECLGVLDRLDEALTVMDRNSDPCNITGAGWIAEEAFATALLCFLLYPNDPRSVIQRAAYSSGDSDSIACIAGAFAGAHRGMDEWASSWLTRIEYRDRLDALSASLSRKPV